MLHLPQLNSINFICSLLGLVVQLVQVSNCPLGTINYSSHAPCFMFSFRAFHFGRGSGSRERFRLELDTEGFGVRWSTSLLFCVGEVVRVLYLVIETTLLLYLETYDVLVSLCSSGLVSFSFLFISAC